MRIALTGALFLQIRHAIHARPNTKGKTLFQCRLLQLALEQGLAFSG